MKVEGLKVRDVAAVFNGKTPSKAQQRDEGHPVLKIKDVDALGRFKGSYSGHVDLEVAEKSRKKTICGGETLILNAAHNASHVASKTFYATDDVVGALATGEWLMIRWDEKKVDSRFGHHWINTPETRFRLRGLVNGIHLYPKDVERLNFSLPPLKEQKRIAKILDAADALRAKRRESLAQLDALLQSTFLDLFGDPVENPRKWKTVSFSKIGSFKSGGTPSKANSDYWGEGTPWVSPKDMKVERISKSIDSVTPLALSDTKIKLLDPGHILVVVRGMILAHSFPVAVNDVPVVINQDMKAIELGSDVESTYLLHCLKAKKREVLTLVSSAGHGTRRFDRNAMDELQIPVPDVSLQQRFSMICDHWEKQRRRLIRHAEELDTLFSSIQANAFSGEL